MANYVAMMKMRIWMKELMEVKIIKLEKTNHNNSKLITMTKMTMNNQCSDEKKFPLSRNNFYSLSSLLKSLEL